MRIRKLNREEIPTALDLAWQVFLEFEAPDYTEEGVHEFYGSIHSKSYVQALCFYGAFQNQHLVGVLATRNEGKHIALFFVDKRYQRQGIGRQLFETAKEDFMTVNASPYAVEIYRKLGFSTTDTEHTLNGLRFTPMVYR
ncbi:MAG: GNAT family N-acetyltransferase [Clostridia bacterium]|nr:GNAT family N-acetyltransferase [Clostridia bacterium]